MTDCRSGLLLRIKQAHAGEKSERGHSERSEEPQKNIRVMLSTSNAARHEQASREPGSSFASARMIPRGDRGRSWKWSHNSRGRYRARNVVGRLGESGRFHENCEPAAS